MKRIIAHLVTMFMTMPIIIANVLQVRTVETLIWSIPYIISNSALSVFLVLSLMKKPKDINDSFPMFLISVISANYFVLIVFFGRLFPMGQPIETLITIDKYMHLLVLPFYLWGVMTLGRRLTVMPEANSLQTNGVYRYSRHPLYATYIYWFVLQNFTYQTWSCLFLSVIQIALVIIRARYEEKILEDNFPEYAEYKARVWWIGRIPGTMTTKTDMT